MSPASNPLAPDPETKIDDPPIPDPSPDPAPQEDLTRPVPVGEPADDGGYVIEEEDPEYAPPKDTDPPKNQPRRIARPAPAR